MWTIFMDMNSGGGRKERWTHIYIEAPEDEAKAIFWNRFKHNPERVTCTCCGQDYSIESDADLNQLTAYERNCEWEDGRYVEKQDQRLMDIRKQCNTKSEDPWGLYVSPEKYRQSSTALFIPADEIKPEERKAPIPAQGYVWVG